MKWTLIVLSILVALACICGPSASACGMRVGYTECQCVSGNCESGLKDRAIFRYCTPEELQPRGGCAVGQACHLKGSEVGPVVYTLNCPGTSNCTQEPDCHFITRIVKYTSTVNTHCICE
jgi:hypothetical protein